MTIHLKHTGHIIHDLNNKPFTDPNDLGVRSKALVTGSGTLFLVILQKHEKYGEDLFFEDSDYNVGIVRFIDDQWRIVGYVTDRLEPLPEDKRNIEPLFMTVNDFLDNISEGGYEDKNFKHYIYERALEYFYGKDVWAWLQKQRDKQIDKILNRK